jgi:hypothetical protein
MEKGKETEAHRLLHDSLQNTLAASHERLAQVHADIARLEQQKAILREVAAGELSKASGLSADAVTRLTARCW